MLPAPNFSTIKLICSAGVWSRKHWPSLENQTLVLHHPNYPISARGVALIHWRPHVKLSSADLQVLGHNLLWSGVWTVPCYGTYYHWLYRLPQSSNPTVLNKDYLLRFKPYASVEKSYILKQRPTSNWNPTLLVFISLNTAGLFIFTKNNWTELKIIEMNYLWEKEIKNWTELKLSKNEERYI